MTKRVDPNESPESRAARLARNNEKRRIYREKNRDRLREIDAKYRASLSSEKLEARLRRTKEWQEANADKVKSTRARWLAENQDVMIRHHEKRRALMASVEFFPFSTGELLDTYGTDCHLCGEPIDLGAPRWTGREGWERGLHVDHVVPLSKGGDHTLENCRPSHGLCNLKKYNKV